MLDRGHRHIGMEHVTLFFARTMSFHYRNDLVIQSGVTNLLGPTPRILQCVVDAALPNPRLKTSARHYWRWRLRCRASCRIPRQPHWLWTAFNESAIRYRSSFRSEILHNGT